MWMKERVILATAICASVVCARPHVGGSFNSASVDVSQACGQPPVDAKPENGNFVKSCQNWSKAASNPTFFQAEKWWVALNAGCFEKWIVKREGSDDAWGVRLPLCVGNAGESQYNVMWVDSSGDPHGFFKDETTGNKLPNTWMNSTCECSDEPEDDILPTNDPAEPTEEDPSTTFSPSIMTTPVSESTPSITTTSFPSSSVTENSFISTTPISESTSSPYTSSVAGIVPTVSSGTPASLSNKSNAPSVVAPVAGAVAGAAVLVAAGAAIMKKLHSSSAATAAAASHADLFSAGAGTANPGYVPDVAEEMNPLFHG